MNIKLLDHYALGVIFAPSVCICHLTLVNNKMYFVLKFVDPSRRVITMEEKYCVKLLTATGLCLTPSLLSALCETNVPSHRFPIVLHISLFLLPRHSPLLQSLN